MLTVVFAWFSAITFPIFANRRQSAFAAPLALSTAVLLSLVMVVVWQPPYEYTIGKDRLVYEDSFWRAAASDTMSDFEIGYATVERVFASTFANPSAVFVFAAALFIVALWDLLSQRYAFADRIFLLFITL